MTTSATRPVSVALIGFGWWGRTMARVLADGACLKVKTVVDPTEEGRAAAHAAGLAATADLNAALADTSIEAVIICSPHKFHAAQIEAAARAGKHVFCEKPFCTTGAEARRAIAAVKAAKVKLGIGHERRFEPALLDLIARVKGEDFGTPLVVEGNFSQDKFLALPPDNWRLSTLEAPVGPLSATGIHLVDVTIALLGRPVDVLARLSTRATKFANGDTLTISIGFESGASASLTAILTTPFAGRLAFYGSTGWMEIRDRTHPESPSGWDVTIVKRGVAEPQTSFVPPAPIVRHNLEAFATAITGGPDYPISPEHIQTNVDTFEAIVRSAQTSRIEQVGA